MRARLIALAALLVVSTASYAGDYERVIQLCLTSLGHNPGSIDGVFGKSTRTALRAWQDSRGYNATGELEGAQAEELLVACGVREKPNVDGVKAVESQYVEAHSTFARGDNIYKDRRRVWGVACDKAKTKANELGSMIPDRSKLHYSKRKGGFDGCYCRTSFGTVTCTVEYSPHRE